MDFIVRCFQDNFRVEFVAKFLAIKTDTEISGLSLDFFFKAEYGQNYGCEWLFYVKYFCVLLLAI